MRGVKFVRCTRVYDENKRFAPKFDESTVTEIEGDTVLLSVGQSADLSFIDPQRDGIEMRSPQQIVNDPRNLCDFSARSIHRGRHCLRAAAHDPCHCQRQAGGSFGLSFPTR